MFAAEVWHWWIGVVLALAGIGLFVQLVVGYLRKVVAPQYPKRRQRP
jgi:formate-dependent nitrite reductase membrane component NrfD